ncbi:MAG: hypothetical protein JWO05_1902 [Gemmatimonadetes bacterium]|nr:hypothetical protein [Gemmatimonadota bacterium]
MRALRGLAFSLVTAAACGGDSTAPGSAISFKSSTATLHASEALAVVVQGPDSAKAFAWTSSNTKAATVSGADARGIITAVAPGSTVIQATSATGNVSLNAVVVGGCDTVKVAPPFIRETSIVASAACGLTKQYYSLDNTTNAGLMYKLTVRNYQFDVLTVPIELFGGTIASSAPSKGSPLTFIIAAPAHTAVPFSVSIATFGGSQTGGTFTMDASVTSNVSECSRTWTIPGSEATGTLNVSGCARTVAGTTGKLAADFTVNAAQGASVLVRVVANGFEPAVEWRDFTGKAIASAVAAAGSNTVTLRFTAQGGMHLFTLGTRTLGQTGSYTLTIEN